jgi:hypothetical protein
LPGRPATDQQMRMYMELRRHHPQRVAAAKTGFSERTGRRIEGDPRLPSQKAAERPLRRQVADPLGGLWESDILPLLVTRPRRAPCDGAGRNATEPSRSRLASAAAAGSPPLWSHPHSMARRMVLGIIRRPATVLAPYAKSSTAILALLVRKVFTGDQSAG